MDTKGCTLALGARKTKKQKPYNKSDSGNISSSIHVLYISNTGAWGVWPHLRE